MSNILEEIMTVTEAAQHVGITEGALRSCIMSGRIKPNEWRKAGRISLVLKSAVEREYKREGK